MNNLIPAPLSLKEFQILNEHIKDPKYKTEMCKNWEKFSSCPYNTKCRFAHGKKELLTKEVESNPNYRVKDCLNFFNSGFCSYGKRCCFKHDERKLNEKNLEADFKVFLSLVKPIGKTRLPIFKSITEKKEEVKGKNGFIRSLTHSSEKIHSFDSTQDGIDLN